VCLLRLLVTFASLLPALSAATFTIAGVVVQHASNTPLRRARVSIASLGDRDRWISVVTGNQSEFSFTGLPAGKYSIAADVRGGRHLFQQNEGFSTAIAVGPNLDSEHIVFAMDAAAAINGSVVDEDGDPVANAQILLFRRGIVSGRLKTALLYQASTSAAGEFHVRNLTPGTYFAAVQARPWFAQYQPRPPNAPQNANELDVVYPLTYYPGSTNLADATPLSLADGATSDLRLTLRAVPALHIALEGTLPEELPQLFQLGPGGTEIAASSVVSFADAARRELSGVPPGDYIVNFQRVREGVPEGAGRMAVTLTGDATINVGELRKMGITGTVILPQRQRTRSPGVRLENVANGHIVQSMVAQDGSFHFNAGSTPPGRYELRLEDSELYMQAIAVKGATYSRGELDVHDGSSIQLSITAAQGLSNVTGTATKDGQTYGGAMILLIPQDFSHGSYFPRDQSDSDGTFSLNSAPPGRYTLLAIEDGHELAYHDPAAIAPYLKQGQSIEIPLPPGTETKIEVQRLKL